LLLNVFLWIGALAVLIGNQGQLAQPIVGLHSFTQTPNPKYSGDIIAALAFVVYPLFAYGGLEAVGGLVDETENPEKTFPKRNSYISSHHLCRIFIRNTVNWNIHKLVNCHGY
jgi:amino acid transporter